MSCVFTGLINALHTNKFINRVSPDKFMTNIKLLNEKTNRVTCQGQKLSKKKLIENFNRIKSIDNLYNGYLMSTEDPLLLLICQLYKVDIIHHFNGVIIKYEYKYKSKGILKVHSNLRHFWY